MDYIHALFGKVVLISDKYQSGIQVCLHFLQHGAYGHNGQESKPLSLLLQKMFIFCGLARIGFAYYH